MHRIISYAQEYRSALLDLSLRAWEPVFPVVRNEVPGFVRRVLSERMARKAAQGLVGSA